MAKALKNLEDKLQNLLLSVDPENLQYNENTFIDGEFDKFKQQGIDLLEEPNYSRTEAALDVNKKKNRYRDIIPFDRNRVRLDELDDDNAVCSDYINASIVKGASGENEYIAAQGPVQRTVNDFWRMIWEYGIKVVVMACREKDGEKIKCSTYWPTTINETKTFGVLSVELIGEDQHTHGNHTVRRLRLTRNGQCKTVIQHHYIGWPDHGIPTNMEPIINLIYAMRRSQDNLKSPILIHCSAGCGRTGTLIALDYISNMFDLNLIKEDIDIFELCLELRKQRMSMVQTKDQYEMIYRGAISILNNKLDIEDNDYENIPGKTKPARSKPPIKSKKPTLKQHKMGTIQPRKLSDNSSLAAQLMGDNELPVQSPIEAPVQSPIQAPIQAPVQSLAAFRQSTPSVLSLKQENSTTKEARAELPTPVVDQFPVLPSVRKDHSSTIASARQEAPSSLALSQTSSKPPIACKGKVKTPPAIPAREELKNGKPERPPPSYGNISLRRSASANSNTTSKTENVSHSKSVVYSNRRAITGTPALPSPIQPVMNPAYTAAAMEISATILVDDSGEVDSGELPMRSQRAPQLFPTNDVNGEQNSTYASIDDVGGENPQDNTVTMKRHDENDTYAYADPRALNKWSLQKIARGYEDVDIISGADNSEYQDVDEDQLPPPVPMKSRGAFVGLNSEISTSSTSLNTENKSSHQPLATLKKGIQGAFKGLGMKKNKQQRANSDSSSDTMFDIDNRPYKIGPETYNIAFPNKVPQPKGEVPTPNNLK